MRIVCLTENLGSGGAERQLAELAVLLAQAGHDVCVVLYHTADHYRPRLEEYSIPIYVITYRNKLHRIIRLRKTLRGIRPDIVIVFKRNPALYVELSSLLGRDYRLIVSERNYDYRGMSVGTCVRLLLHALADVVVTNSKSQYDFIRARAFWLKARTKWIPNTIDIETFQPAKVVRVSDERSVKILVLARFAWQKNAVRFAQAVNIFRQRHPGIELVVDWYGSNFFVDGVATALSRAYLSVKDEIRQLELQEVIRLHGPVLDVVPLLHQCDALCLPSFCEGFSNVIAEAIACGVPVLAGNVSDNPLMVRDGENGFLFDPEDTRDIVRAIVKFSTCTLEERLAMARRSREIAESLFSPVQFVRQYEKLFVAHPAKQDFHGSTEEPC